MNSVAPVLRMMRTSSAPGSVRQVGEAVFSDGRARDSWLSKLQGMAIVRGDHLHTLATSKAMKRKVVKAVLCRERTTLMIAGHGPKVMSE